MLRMWSDTGVSSASVAVVLIVVLRNGIIGCSADLVSFCVVAETSGSVIVVALVYADGDVAHLASN
jgi:hypothetical protein